MAYTPKKSPDLTAGSWADLTSTPTVTSIDADWERVVYEEPYDPAVTTECFTVVEVSLP